MVASVAEAAAAAAVLSCAQATLPSATAIDSMERTDVYPTMYKRHHSATSKRKRERRIPTHNHGPIGKILGLVGCTAAFNMHPVEWSQRITNLSGRAVGDEMTSLCCWSVPKSIIVV